MTETIQSNLKCSTSRQTAMNNIEHSNPDLPDYFQLTCKVTLVTTYVKLQMSNYYCRKSKNIPFSVANLVLFSMLNAGNSKIM